MLETKLETIVSLATSVAFDASGRTVIDGMKPPEPTADAPPPSPLIVEADAPLAKVAEPDNSVSSAEAVGGAAVPIRPAEVEEVMNDVPEK